VTGDVQMATGRPPSVTLNNLETNMTLHGAVRNYVIVVMLILI
jgi:hypothetical protein